MRHTATQAIFQKKRHWGSYLKKWGLSGLGILLLTACSLRLAPQKPHEAFETSFFSMGTRWSISLRGLERAEDFQKVKEKLVSFALHYEMTFSDWSDDSELRRLEKNGMGQLQSGSDLFMEGLFLAKEAHQKTAGLFDITVGAVTWGVLDRPVGLDRLVIDAETHRFYFEAEHGRLSFGGLAKGMAVGEMASFLISQGVKAFWIDAGGGDRASFEGGRVRFESRSRVFKAASNSEKHIHSPQKGRPPEERETATIVCVPEGVSRASLIRWGALTDAFATARVLGSGWSLPEFCSQ
jgi:hypothetical protein